MIAEIRVPYPPSANRYWRHPQTGKLAGRHLISAEGRAYRKAVQEAALLERWPAMGSDPLRVMYAVPRPDARRRDLSNLLKALEDALTHAGVWQDDSQVQAFAIAWVQADGDPRIRVRIERAAAAPLPSFDELLGVF